MRKLLSAITTAAALALLSSASSAYNVAPLVHELSPSNATASMTIDNSDGKEPLTISVETFEVTDPNDPKNSRKPSGDIIVFPPQAIVAPGARQTLRLQVANPPSGSAKTYHIVVTQVPVNLNAGSGGNIAMKIGVNYFARVTVNPN